ncbi:MAG: EutN/CcmL family microcompartment protein, partial [Candidatus Acidiferrales bacterium]
LLVQPIDRHGRAKGRALVAVDSVGAGAGETVLVVSGSSARMAAECKDRPVDAAIIGIVDEVKLDARHEAELAAARRK